MKKKSLVFLGLTLMTAGLAFSGYKANNVKTLAELKAAGQADYSCEWAINYQCIDPSTGQNLFDYETVYP